MITAENITDAQIREAWETCGNCITGRQLMVALAEPFPWGEYPSAAETHKARARVAHVLNTRDAIIAEHRETFGRDPSPEALKRGIGTALLLDGARS